MRSRDASLVTSLLLLAVFFVAVGTAADTWRGLVVAPERRCSPYDKKRDYSYPQSIEHEIVRRLGAVYGPYTGTCFASTRQTDIEHMVAASEAHDSGLCARDRATRARFASDLRNLTLAAPHVNRHQKSGKDAADSACLPNRMEIHLPGRTSTTVPETTPYWTLAPLGSGLDACVVQAPAPTTTPTPGASPSLPIQTNSMDCKTTPRLCLRTSRSTKSCYHCQLPTSPAG